MLRWPVVPAWPLARVKASRNLLLPSAAPCDWHLMAVLPIIYTATIAPDPNRITCGHSVPVLSTP